MTNGNRTLQAGLAMLGTIIGAGVFAVPSVFKTFGIPWGTVIFWGVAALILATHLLMAEVVLARKGFGKKRMPGYVAAILGPRWGMVAFFSHPAQILGACLAYLILGGEFLAAFGQSISKSILFWQVAFWVGGALTVLYGLRFVAKVESVLTWLLIATLLICVGLFAPQANPFLFFQNTVTWTLAPMGILVFSLFGMTVIPEIIDIVGGDREKTRLGIVAGSLGAALLMWLFGVFAYASAPHAAANAVEYAKALPTFGHWLIPAVGFLAVSTSFITLMEALKRMLIYDAKLKPQLSWSISLLSPLVLLLVTQRDLLATISFVGGVFSALNGLFASAMGGMILKRRWPFFISAIFLLLIVSRILALI